MPRVLAITPRAAFECPSCREAYAGNDADNAIIELAMNNVDSLKKCFIILFYMVINLSES